jgi:N-acetylmuramoyl-L-alanine amidase
MSVRAIFALLLALLFVHSAAMAGIEDVRVVGNGDPTRVTIWSTQPQAADAYLGIGEGRARLIRLPLEAVSPSKGGGGGGGVAAWQTDGDTLTLTLEQPMMVARALSLPPTGSETRHRVILDLQTVSNARFARAAERDARRLAKARTRAAQRFAKGPTLKPKRPDERIGDGRYVVVIDPGHGGKDPGAIAVTGAHEKEIVLKASLALKHMLEADPRYDVRLTRDDDTYVEHEDRVTLARKWGADLFISVHADAAGKPTVSGASIYTISASGQKRIEKEARKNNWDIPIEHGGDEQVGGILEDLVKRETKTRSAEFAEIVLPELKKAGPVVRNSHRHAGFYVLLAPDVPAVLLEMGFLTNSADAQRLASEAGRRKTMQAVKRGIDRYFDQQDVMLAGN